MAMNWFRLALAALTLALLTAPAHASMFKGEALDTAADILTWVVLIVAPHPQAKAIQTLCILSLFFGGLLWPLAWLWAYTKPVMYKLAYGTDTVEPEHGDKDKPAEAQADTEELKRLRAQVAELQSRLAGKPAAEGEKA